MIKRIKKINAHIQQNEIYTGIMSDFSEMINVNEIRIFINELDGNADGVVSWSEYYTALTSQSHEIEL
jgi:hypothetical protein